MQSHRLLNPSIDVSDNELVVWASMMVFNVALATSALISGMKGALAPYGGFNSESSRLAYLFGPKINSKAGWFIMELPALFAAIYALYLSGVSEYSKRPLHLQYSICCYLIHYFNRGVVYPAKRGKSDKYEPCGTFFLGAIFNCMNGYAICRYLLHFGAETALDNRGIITWLGVCVFLFGAYVNVMADALLMNLSRSKKTKGSRGNIKSEMCAIPHGFFAFNYVTSANYFGEIVEWIGFLMMTWPSPASVCFAWMTFCNLSPRAHARHQKYLRRIPGYSDLNRSAIIPYLW